LTRQEQKDSESTARKIERREKELVQKKTGYRVTKIHSLIKEGGGAGDTYVCAFRKIEGGEREREKVL